MKSRLYVFGAFLLGLVLFAAQPPGVDAQNNLPWVGKWTLNTEKSTSNASTNRSGTRVYEMFEGNGLKFHGEVVQAGGNRVTQEYSSHFDGKGVSWMVTGGTGTPPATISETRLDANTFAYVYKSRDGVILSRGINTISRDGRTMTTVGVNAETGLSGGATVWDKQ